MARHSSGTGGHPVLDLSRPVSRSWKKPDPDGMMSVRDADNTGKLS